MATFESSSADLLGAHTRICTQIFNFKNSAALKCAVQLGIPDVLQKHGKPMTLSELTSTLPINPSKAGSIVRILRILVNAGIFTQEKEGYSLASAGHLLHNDEPLNERALVLMILDIAIQKPYNALSEWFKNDDPTPFYTAHGKNLWDYNVENPKFGKLFDDAMACNSQVAKEVLVSDCKFVFEGLTSLVDVGGGTGTIARGIANAFPNLKCTVYDLPHVVANQEGDVNLDFIGGSMLDKVPNANAILLKNVLHDWNDENCVKILKNCKKAIPGRDKGGKVIIIEMVMEGQIDNNDTIEAQISVDMQMFVLCDAKERTEKEWATIITNAGFSSYKVFPVLNPRSIIEVYP